MSNSVNKLVLFTHRKFFIVRDRTFLCDLSSLTLCVLVLSVYYSDL
jgi:hypothetical protein